LTPVIAGTKQTHGDFKWPEFKEAKYNLHLQKFMLSFKNIYSDNINASNLLFITGPTKSGKSFLVRNNIGQFLKSK